tara:strand:+ start:4286 stop:5557 length:1272 start_codon:yes stop_codon:yes gene_type:complete
LEHIVLTSINPFAKLDYQKLCFEQWKATGHTIRTVNSTQERDLLLKNGFASDDIFEVAISETGKGLFGKAVPRIMPLLEKAKTMDCDHYLLTNSDIFPATRKPVFNALSSQSHAIALTRNECFNVACTNFLSDSPYRGGLDTFYFNRVGLDSLSKELRSYKVSERMAFGIPGWDYFIGYFIWKSGGTIMDSHIFLHQSHPTTYSALSEFSYFSDVMIESQRFSGDTNQVAYQFAQLITEECENNERASKVLKHIFYAKPNISFEPEADIGMLSSIKAAAQNLLSEVGIRKEFDTSLLAFLDSQRVTVNWVAAKSFRDAELDNLSLISKSFVTLYVLLLLHSKKQPFRFSHNYPEGSLHGAALRQIIENTSGNERLGYLIDLFCAELVEHRIYNAELFKYFVWEAKSAQQIKLVMAVLTLLQKG